MNATIPRKEPASGRVQQAWASAGLPRDSGDRHSASAVAREGSLKTQRAPPPATMRGASGSARSSRRGLSLRRVFAAAPVVWRRKRSRLSRHLRRISGWSPIARPALFLLVRQPLACPCAALDSTGSVQRIQLTTSDFARNHERTAAVAAVRSAKLVKPRSHSYPSGQSAAARLRGRRTPVRSDALLQLVFAPRPGARCLNGFEGGIRHGV